MDDLYDFKITQHLIQPKIPKDKIYNHIRINKKAKSLAKRLKKDWKEIRRLLWVGITILPFTWTKTTELEILDA